MSTLSCWRRAGAPANARPPPGLWVRPRFRVLANDGHLKAHPGLCPPPGSAGHRQDSGSWPRKPPHHVCLSPLCLTVSVCPHKVEAPGQGEASLSEPDFRGEAHRPPAQKRVPGLVLFGRGPDGLNAGGRTCVLRGGPAQRGASDAAEGRRAMGRAGRVPMRCGSRARGCCRPGSLGWPPPLPSSSWAPRGRSGLGVLGVTWAGAPGTSPQAQREGRWHLGHLTSSLSPPRADLRRVAPHPTHRAPDGYLSLETAGRPLRKSPPNHSLTQGWGWGHLREGRPPFSPPDGVSVAAAHTQVGGGGCGTSVRAAGSGGGGQGSGWRDS